MGFDPQAGKLRRCLVIRNGRNNPVPGFLQAKDDWGAKIQEVPGGICGQEDGESMGIPDRLHNIV
jgi:hypothetical protein